MKKLMFVVLAVFMAINVMASVGDVVKQLLPDSNLQSTTFTLTDAVIAKIQAVHGNKAAVKGTFEIYASKTGAVIIEEQQGKHGPIKMAILIDAATKKIKDIVILAMKEQRGAGIKQKNFISQFIGKGTADPIALGKDIKAISGATISSKAVVIATKRALIVYEAFSAK